MTKYTTYRIASHWLHNSFILCNEIEVLDSHGLEFEFEWEDDCEIFQWYLTDCSKDDVEFLKKTFDLKFAYSPKLDLYVLCVDHCGTSWDYVGCKILDESILEYNPNIEYTDSCNPPKFEYNRKIIAGGKEND